MAVLRKFQDDQAGYLAALIGYFGFVALFPLLLIFVTVLDMTLASDPQLRSDLLNSALAQYPVIGAEIGGNLGSIPGSGLSLGIGILVLLLGTRGVASAMQNALCQVWELPRAERPAFWRRWLYGLALVLVIGLGLVVTTFLSGVAGGAGHVLTGFVAHAGAVAISLTANVGVFWVAFRLASMRKVRWRDLRLGAALAAATWQALQVAGGYVAAHQLHRTSALYGTFGVVLGLLGWLYLQATVTLYCAEIDAVLVGRRWPRSLRGSGEAGPAWAAVPRQQERARASRTRAAPAGPGQPEAGQDKALQDKAASRNAVNSEPGNGKAGQGTSAA